MPMITSRDMQDDLNSSWQRWRSFFGYPNSVGLLLFVLFVWSLATAIAYTKETANDFNWWFFQVLQAIVRGFMFFGGLQGLLDHDFTVEDKKWPFFVYYFCCLCLILYGGILFAVVQLPPSKLLLAVLIIETILASLHILFLLGFFAVYYGTAWFFLRKYREAVEHLALTQTHPLTDFRPRSRTEQDPTYKKPTANTTRNPV